MSDLRGAGEKVAERLRRLSIFSVEDLLFHLPNRYQDRTRLTPIALLAPGTEALVEGTVESVESAVMPRRVLKVTIGDDSGSLGLRFFHFGAGLRKLLQLGTRVRCFGEPRAGFLFTEMIHPEIKPLSGSGIVPVEDRLTPVYPITEGLQQKAVRSLVGQALDLYLAHGEDALADCLPPSMRRRLALPPLRESLERVHRPTPETAATALTSGSDPAIRRLAFEELLAHHLSLRQLRYRARNEPAPPLAGDSGLVQGFIGSLQFRLTAAQTRVLAEIGADLALGVPMMRLLQGDVGCGKTVVAAAAMLCAVAAERQAVLMAPTELLAEQHFASLRAWVGPLGVAVVALGGRLKGSSRKEAMAAIASGRAGVVVGTHALFQGDVVFRNLALVVVDEQHRFGVHQRLALREKGRHSGVVPHQLIMTATPIPRTLAMTAYADLDVSVIDELPPGRTAIKTVVLGDRRRAEVVRRVSEACGDGRQAYWVCTLVEESEVLEAKAAEDTAVELKKALPHLRVGLAHGRQKASEREGVMAAFKSGDLNLLVATTVIEVGVDVPNASLMIIENAERLGLAQLHQLRGRVGRGSRDSYCLLMYRGRLSDAARSRLEIVRDSTDGFEIARRDLELRGPGEVMGVRQTGELRFRVVDLVRDRYLFDSVQGVADEFLSEHPELVKPLLRRWIGEDGRYGEV